MNMLKNISKPLLWTSTVLLVAVLSACGGSSGGGVASGSALGAAGPGLGVVGTVCSGASCVNLGTAGKYAILAQTAVSTVPNSVVTGNVGLSPAARGFLTGWSLITEPTDTSFGSAQVTGRLFAADNVGGTTAADLTTAVGDMGTAYTTAAGMPLAGGGLTTACPNAGIFGGQTIVAGVYKCTPAVGIAAGTNLTLNGTATDVWVFQLAGGYTQAAATQVILTGGALPKNVFWVSAATVSVGATAVMQGVILSQTNIVMGTGATEKGRLLAQTAVTLDQDTVTQP